LNRRDAIAQIALLAGGSLAARFAQAALRGTSLHVAPSGSAFNAEQRAMVETLAELIIPRTDTPGAIDAGVPVFIDQVVSSWYTPVERSIFMDGLNGLDAFCVNADGRRFNECDTAQRTRALTHADEGSRNYDPKPVLKVRDAPDEQSPFFHKLKLLTVLGYYTSEVGATQELSYNPVPGRYDGDIDFDKVGRQWSY
jgi:Gluconate 2-dehydrogenase subunit 3